MSIKLVYPSGWRNKLDGGHAAFERALHPIVERAFKISCAISLGTDVPERTGFNYRSLFSNDLWFSADGTPKNLRDGKAFYIYFFDVMMFGIGDMYTDNRKKFWRSIRIHGIGHDVHGLKVAHFPVGTLEHLWVSTVEWDHPDFFKLARPTYEIGPDFTGESARAFCNAFKLKLADHNELKRRHPNFEIDYPAQEHLQLNGSWKLVGYPVSGFLFTRKADRNRPTPLE